MYKKLVLVGILVMMLALVFANDAVMAVKPEPVGVQLNIYGAPITLSAGEPFHITHGFIAAFHVTEPISNLIGKTEMVITVNGVELEPSYSTVEHLDALPEAPYHGFLKLWTYNIPDGFTPGTYLFERHYYFSCLYLLMGGSVEECENPNAMMEDPMMPATTRVVTFE